MSLSLSCHFDLGRLFLEVYCWLRWLLLRLDSLELHDLFRLLLSLHLFFLLSFFLLTLFFLILMLSFHYLFLNESFILSVRFVSLFNLDHFIATFATDKSVDFSPEVFLLFLFLLDLFLEDIFKSIAEFELSF